MTQVTSNVIFRAWGVASPKGNAVFLDHTRAMEYAGKMHGVLVDLSTTYNVQETRDYSYDIRQEGQAVVERCELIPEESSCNGTGSKSCRAGATDISTCGNSCSCTTEGLEQSASTGDNPL